MLIGKNPGLEDRFNFASNLCINSGALTNGFNLNVNLIDLEDLRFNCFHEGRFDSTSPLYPMMMCFASVGCCRCDVPVFQRMNDSDLRIQGRFDSLWVSCVCQSEGLFSLFRIMYRARLVTLYFFSPRSLLHLPKVQPSCSSAIRSETSSTDPSESDEGM